MELNESDKNGMERRSSDPLNFQSPDWPFAHFPCENSIPLASSCSSVPMVNSFCPNIWVHPSSPNAVFSENTIQATTSTSNMVASQRSDPTSRGSGMERPPLKADWNPRNIMPKGSVYFPTGTGVLPPSLPEFPADSEFIERAARFSCFNSRNFNDMANSFGISESVSPYSSNGGIHATKDLPSNSLNLVSGTQSEELRTNDVPKDISSPFGRGVTQRSLVKNQNGSGRFLAQPSDEGKQIVGISSNESDEPEFSEEAQEEPSNLENTMLEPSNEGVCTKRKRSSQATQLDQVNENPRVSPEMTEDKMETVQNGEQNQTSSSHTPNGKCRKDSSPNSDAPKEDYIHVRARRGQATNSHSLAERVRREKISERMKFLQDLVPGCSKVTGKAVMLDEIINYVQSLQRQVEFLSMKLATVNPNPDFNIERLLPKDILQTRNGISTIFGFSPGVSRPLPHLHPSQQGLLPAGIPCIGSPSDGLRRNINSQMTTMNGYREPQMSSAWDDEFQSVFPMSFGATVPSSTEDLNGSLPPSNMKVEL